MSLESLIQILLKSQNCCDQKVLKLSVFWKVQNWLTCVPDVLDPDVGARGKEKPMNRDEEKANHVGGESDADEEY